MRLANFILPWLPLGPCGPTSFQERGLHIENCDSRSGIAPTDFKAIFSDLAVRLTGAALMTLTVERQTVTETLNVGPCASRFSTTRSLFKSYDLHFMGVAVSLTSLVQFAMPDNL